jgi:hypothetical protein
MKITCIFLNTPESYNSEKKKPLLVLLLWGKVELSNLAGAVMFLTCNQEVTLTNLAWDTDYRE